MKIYVVTSGAYSDYHINAVFTNYVMAQKYANLDSERVIEEFDSDQIHVDESTVIRIGYDYKHERIDSYETTDIMGAYYLYDFSNKFTFCVKPGIKVLNDVQEHGKQSQLLLKIARDRFAKYLYEHDTTREELLKRNEPEEEENPVLGPEEMAKVFTENLSMFNCGILAKQLAASGQTSLKIDDAMYRKIMGMTS